MGKIPNIKQLEFPSSTSWIYAKDQANEFKNVFSRGTTFEQINTIRDTIKSIELRWTGTNTQLYSKKVQFKTKYLSKDQ